MPTNAEAIAQVLRESGVRRCFGHPGGEIVVFIDACRRVGIEFVLTGHEGSAAFMADVTGHLTGTPGVCLATVGPGATNLATGVANAYLDRSPAIVVTAQVSTRLDPSYTHQRVDLNAFFAPITKWTVTIDGAGTRQIAERAVALACQPRRGPVHICLPSDLASQPVRADAPSISLPPIAGPAASDGQEIVGIAEAVSGARRPILVVGTGVRTDAVAPAMRRFLQAASIPFVTTPKVKGVVDEDDPLFLGIASGMAGDDTVLKVLDDADLLIGVGFDPVECDKDWFAGRRFVTIDDVGQASAGYRPVVESVGDVASALTALASRISHNHAWTAEEIRMRRERIADAVRPAAQPEHGLSPHAVLGRLRAALPPDGIVACDVGAHKQLIGQVWRTSRPATFLMSNGLSAMGYGLSAAIAAKLEYPDRPVLCVTGDGGFLMGIHNLELIARRDVPVVAVVFTDTTLAAIKVAQTRRHIAPYGVDFGRPDYVRVAEAFGLVGRHVDALDEVMPSCREALASGRPVVIDVPIDPREYWQQM
jgi:acetolactate synthase-1/2/3 large subunit